MAVKIGPNANFKGFILTRKNNDLSESRHPKRSYVLALLSAAVLPLMLFMLYFTISFMDLWGYAPDIVQAVGLLLCSIMATIVFGWTLYKKVIFSPKLIAVRLAVCLITMTFFALWSNDDFTRLSTLAFKPRALTDYPEPIIIATVTSPLYLGHDSVQKDMSIQQTANRGLNPIYEGSILDVHVKNTPWRPIIKLSDGSKVTFEEQMDGSFKASTKIEQQISWSVNQGTYTIGAWPIILIEDQAPMIKNFTLEADGNDKGYLAFNVDILDDHKIMDVGLEIITDDYSKLADDDQLKLPIREIKSYQNIFYVDFTDTDYSGIEVDLKLNVEDEVGQISTALLHDIKLPEKRFNHLIANKLISLRKELNQKHYDIKSLSRQLLALGLLSESEGLPFVYYMALRSAYWRVTDPAGPEDLQIAKDLLWDTAIRIESGGVSDIEKTLLSQLDELNLILGQKKSFSDIRLQIRETDKVFRQYSRAIRKSYSNLYSLDIDFKSLRKLYSYILTFSDKEKYYNASLVVDVLRKGVVFNDELVLSQGGLGNYFALSEGRKIIENLISIQKSLLANSYNEQMKKSQNIKRKQKYSSQKNTQESIKLQSKVGDAVKLLGEKISFTGMSSEFLIQDASNLIEAILTNMKTDEYSRVAQSQTELIIVMSNLKRILNKPATRSPELQNIIQEINGQPTS